VSDNECCCRAGIDRLFAIRADMEDSSTDDALLAMATRDASQLSATAFRSKYSVPPDVFRASGIDALRYRGEYVHDGFVVPDGDGDTEEASSALTEVCSSNIVTGKRKRKPPQSIYDDPEFKQQVESVFLADIPGDELVAALEDDIDDIEVTSEDDESAAQEAGSTLSEASSSDDDYIESCDDSDSDLALTDDDDLLPACPMRHDMSRGGACQSAAQPASQPASQPAPQPASQPASQPALASLDSARRQ